MRKKLLRGILVAGALCGALVSSPARAAPMGIVVPVGPPAARVERRIPRRPAPTFVWIGGHWAWRAGRSVWVGGAWAPPPRPEWRWEPARWSFESGHWVYYEGYWRPAMQPRPLAVYQPPLAGAPIVVRAVPPPLLIESRPELPRPDAVWIPGYWSWSGRRYVWIGGVWSAPRPGWVWIAPQWQRRSDGRWQWLPGHWQARVTASAN
ncbi:MAG TPA: hypothetical protein VF945_04905 [Polyangia bacterium]